MATKKVKSARMSKKIARQLVYDTLAVALSKLKPAIKNKKFENRLRKTSKIFASYVIKNADREGDIVNANKKESKTEESIAK